MKTKSINLLLSIVAAAALTACGGGSGGGTAATPTTPTVYTANCADLTVKTSTISQSDAQAQCVPVVKPVTSSIVPSVPGATYAAGSEELAAFNLLNAERNKCGFGLLKQNTQLDVSAKGHADWLLVNGDSAIGHYQTVGTPLFTGITPKEREAVAGYGAGSFEASEVTAKIGITSKAGQGISRVRDLLNLPYHEIAMLRGYRDVGISVRDQFDLGLMLNRTAANIDFGYTYAAGMQASPAGTLRTYPCDGSSGINRLMGQEIPSPVPERNIVASPLGTSIAVIGDVGTTLSITSASMINATTGASVTLRTPVMAASDPYGGTYLLSNEGYVLADASLDPLTSYKVTINGTNNSAGFATTFTFTTGSGDQR